MVNNKWLNTAEQVSIAAAIAGTVAAEVTRQTIFVSAPLSFALCLSLLNRTRAQQANQQSVDVELGQLRRDLCQLDQKVWQDVESLREGLLALPTAPEPMDMANVKGFVESLRTELENHLAPLQTLDVGAIHAGMTQLQTEVGELQANMNDLISQPLEITTPDLEPLQVQIHQLNQRLEDSSTHTGQVEARLSELHETLNHLRNSEGSIQVQAPTAEELAPLLDARLEERLAELRGTLAHLEQQSVPPDLEALIESKLDARLSDLQSTPPSVEVAGNGAVVAELRQLQQRQETLEQEIIRAVRTELQTHFSLLAEVGFNSIHTGLAQVQTEVGQLKSQVETLTAQPGVDLTPLHLEMGQLKTEVQAIASQLPVDLTPLQTEMAYLHHQVSQLPAPFDPAPLEQRLDDLKHLIGRLEQEAEQSPLKQDLTVFFSAMRHLYNHQTAALS